jgi:hypothetical protein
MHIVPLLACRAVVQRRRARHQSRILAIHIMRR